MRLFTKMTIAAIAAAGAVLSAAEVIDLNNKDFWIPLKNVTFSEGQMVNEGRTMYRSKKTIAIDPAKKYTISMTVSNAEGKKSSYLLFGMSPATAKGGQISASSLQSIKDTFTQVVADAKKGDKTITVKDASKWNKSPHCTIALNAKEDNSDIPNFAILQAPIEKAEKTGDNWTITLKNPLPKNIAAGTNIRQHINGGYYYFGTRSIAPGKTVECKNSVTGQAPHGTFTARGFHPGMKHAYIIILSDWYSSKQPVTIKNAKLIIE